MGFLAIRFVVGLQGSSPCANICLLWEVLIVFLHLFFDKVKPSARLSICIRLIFTILVYGDFMDSSVEIFPRFVPVRGALGRFLVVLVE